MAAQVRSITMDNQLSDNVLHHAAQALSSRKVSVCTGCHASSRVLAAGDCEPLEHGLLALLIWWVWRLGKTSACLDCLSEGSGARTELKYNLARLPGLLPAKRHTHVQANAAATGGGARAINSCRWPCLRFDNGACRLLHSISLCTANYGCFPKIDQWPTDSPIKTFAKIGRKETQHLETTSSGIDGPEMCFKWFGSLHMAFSTSSCRHRAHPALAIAAP